MRWLFFPTQGEEPAFTPADLPGVVHWWDAVLSSKTGSPGAISQWDDLVGSLDLTQGTGAAQPTDNTATINSLAAMAFDGTDDAMANAGAVSVTTSVHLFIVMKFNALVDADCIIDCGPNSFGNETDNGFGFYLDENSGDTGVLTFCVGTGAAGAELDSSATVGTSNAHLIEAWISTTAQIGVAVDGSANTAVPANGMAAPDPIFLAARSGGLNEIPANYGMIVICNQQITGDDLTAMRSYCQTRWGTP